MEAKKVTVTKAGHPLTLLGTQVAVGDKAPDFALVNAAGESVKLSDFKDKIVVLCVYPSIDTPVCAMQARRFNKSASDLGDNVVILGISKDLPFALKRFCGAEGIDRVETLSDYMASDFGMKYGFLLKENMLLARGVVIVDAEGTVRYVEYVGDITHEPDYTKAIEAAQSLHTCDRKARLNEF